MKTKLILPLLGLALLTFAGCETMAENRAANSALNTELQTVLDLQAKKSTTTKPILIMGHNAEYPNTAGGVDVTLSFQNYSGKTIKYAEFTMTAVNRVGDVTTCSIRHEGTVKLTATGPFATDYSNGVRWENVWYNNTIAFARLDRVELEYMDGAKEVVEGQALDAIQLRPANNVFSAGLQQRLKVSINGTHISLDRRDAILGYTP